MKKALKPKIPPIWWRIFANEYLANGEHATEAYRKARPEVKKGTAATEACKLLKNPNFIPYMNLARARVLDVIDVDQDIWLKRLVSLAFAPVEITSATALNALELYGKVRKFIVESPKEQVINFNMMVKAEMQAIEIMGKDGKLPEPLSVQQLLDAEISEDDR